MSVTVKPGVEFEVIAPAGFMILEAIKGTSKTLGLDLVITSGTDGEHSGTLDPHHAGEAYDVRSRTLTAPQKTAVLASMMGILGTTRFYGFLENPGDLGEHFHFQRAKNTTFTVEDLLDA